MYFSFFFIQDVSGVKARKIQALSRSLSMMAAVYELADLMNSQSKNKHNLDHGGENGSAWVIFLEASFNIGLVRLILRSI